MKKRDFNIRILPLVIGLLLITSGYSTIMAQDLRWMRIGSVQQQFMDFGAECEVYPAGTPNFMAWPAQYGDGQLNVRMRALWLGCSNFNDPIEKKVLSVKVVGAGPRYDAANQPAMVFSQMVRLYGRENPPIITVDNQTGTNNTLYDVLDGLQPDLPCDRMIQIDFNTSMGVSVRKKVLAFTQQNHDNYFIHDYVFKNTGIINANGDVSSQTLNNFYVYFNYRYAFAGVTAAAFGSTWGDFSSLWGTSSEYSDFGLYRNSNIRGFYGYYAPDKSRLNISYAEDWGCPNQLGGDWPGVLGSAKYAGAVTLLASKSPQDWTDDNTQPTTTAYIACDANTIMTAPYSQYDDNFMGLRYKAMTEGHLAQTHEQSVGVGNYIADWRSQHPDRDGGGGTTQGQGFGPYTLAPGDSIRIVFAEGVSGISWEQCRSVGAVWYNYYTGTGSPTLKMPDGSVDTSFTNYTRAWVQTGKDSIMQTFRNAIANFNSGYKIPQAPTAPPTFTVKSGGDRIQLMWDPSTGAHLAGYVIYRSQGHVKDYETVYTKLVELDKSVTSYDDTSAVRGFNYYYYIQAKDDGTQNDLYPGVPLYSSKFPTMTSVPAYLRRPSGNLLSEVRVVPNPYDIRERAFQFGTTSQYDHIVFYGLPPVCKLRIYTENGTLIKEIQHTNGSGDEGWDSNTSSGQIVVSGIYILYVEVTEDAVASKDKIAPWDIYNEKLSLIYHKGDLMYHQGDVIFRKGESTFRKFVIIR